MIGFIELHHRIQNGKAAWPFSIAVDSIVSFTPSAQFPDCCMLSLRCGTETIEIFCQESYEEVIAKLEAFQQAVAAASRPAKPFVRTHTRK